MSGHKRATITISQEEYQRLRDLEIRLRSTPGFSSEVHTQISQTTQSLLHQNLSSMENRQQLFVSVLDGFNDQLRSLETNTSQAMVDHYRHFSDDLNRYAGALWRHSNQLVEEQTRAFQMEVAHYHQANQEQITRLERSLRQMEGSQNDKMQMAADWLSSAETLSAFIKYHYNHEMFLPGQIEYLEQRLEQARANLEMGMPEAVLVAAQQLYLRYSEMRVELEQLTLEWQVLFQSAWENTCTLYTEAQALAQGNSLPAADVEGNLLPYDLDVNFWTGNRYTDFLEEVNLYLTRLEDTDHPLDLYSLQQLLNTEAPRLEETFENLILEARVSALNAQMRVNIADMVVEALQEQGFSLEEASFQQVDMREPYLARLSNYEGGQVMVTVSPYGNDLGENELHLESLDVEQRTSHELRQRWIEVHRALVGQGLDVGQPETAGSAGRTLPQPVNGQVNSRRQRSRSVNGR